MGYSPIALALDSTIGDSNIYKVVGSPTGHVFGIVLTSKEWTIFFESTRQHIVFQVKNVLSREGILKKAIEVYQLQDYVNEWKGEDNDR